MKEKNFNELKAIALATIEDKSLVERFPLDFVIDCFESKLSKNEADRDSIIEEFKMTCKSCTYERITHNLISRFANATKMFITYNSNELFLHIDYSDKSGQNFFVEHMKFLKMQIGSNAILPNGKGAFEHYEVKKAVSIKDIRHSKDVDEDTLNKVVDVFNEIMTNVASVVTIDIGYGTVTLYEA